MRHRAQHVLDGVNRLQDHYFAETLILVRLVTPSASGRVGVPDRGHDLVGCGTVGNLFRGQQIIGNRIVIAAAAVVHCGAKTLLGSLDSLRFI